MRKFINSIKNINSELEESSSIVEFIMQESTYTLYQVFQFVIDNDIYATFRRNYSFYRDLLKEKRLNN